MKRFDASDKRRCIAGRKNGSLAAKRSSYKPTGCVGRVKKLCWHTTFGTIAVEEPQYRSGTHISRPFSGQAQVTNRCCSQPLQRVVTDFGADVAFGQVVVKLREHDGIELASETIRGIVEGHAQGRLEQHARAED